MEQGKSLCRCPHHKLVPAFIFLIGLVILLGNLEMLSEHIVKLTWPTLVGLIGLQKMFQNGCRCCYKGECLPKEGGNNNKCC